MLNVKMEGVNMTLKEIEEQHFAQYKEAVKLMIRDNNRRLIEEDILPFFEEPPLDSMDMMKQKFLSVAKEENLILNWEIYSSLVCQFRVAMKEIVPTIFSFREQQLIAMIEVQEDLSKTTVLKISQQDYKKVDKKLRNDFSKQLLFNINRYLITHLTSLVDDVSRLESLSLYLKGRYIETILTLLDSKLALKNNLLRNNLKEQSHRYLFTKKNSHLFDETTSHAE